MMPQTFDVPIVPVIFYKTVLVFRNRFPHSTMNKSVREKMLENCIKTVCSSCYY